MNILNEMCKYIRSETIVDLGALKGKFPGRSVTSINRDLAKLRCISSYTDNSRYYTLPDIPNYDEHGLWRHGNVMFSRNGTAKETVRVLIDESPSGLSHYDLQGMLGIRLYNPLKALVREKAIISVPDGNRLMFFSGDEDIRKRQRDRHADAHAAMADHPFDLIAVIDVLLAVFLEGKDTVDEACGFPKAGKHPRISRKEVEEIFTHYKLPGKKN